jgi:hypothetical protein
METSAWLKEYNNAIKNVKSQNIKKENPTLNILKVNQLDAELLDMEIKFRLNGYFSRIFMFFNVKNQIKLKKKAKCNFIFST